MKKHRCKYNIIGTAFVPSNRKIPIGNTHGYIQTDIICLTCGKSGTIYIDDKFTNTVIKQASHVEYLHNIPLKYCLSENQFKNLK